MSNKTNRNPLAKVTTDKKKVTAKPVYKLGVVGWFLSKVCINFTRWLADKVFGAFANWVESKLKK